MRLTGKLIEEISILERENGIICNKLIGFVLSLGSGLPSVVKAFLKVNGISKEEASALIGILSEREILNKKDLETISKIDKASIVEQEDLNHAIEEIIYHLNAITHTKKTVTKNRKNLILRWLRKGYTIEQFRKVNLLFYDKWHDDPNMEQYIRPETLYNLKFPERVEEAELVFEKLEEYHEDILTICQEYKGLFEKLIVQPMLGLKNEKMLMDKLKKNSNECEYLPLRIQKRIAFWIRKGFSPSDIINTIRATIEQWSKKEELIPYINLEKILDRKFPERVAVSRRVIQRELNKMKALGEWVNS